MLNKIRNFANTKAAGLLVAILIVPFVLWGMGGLFSGGNKNNIVKINNENISTQDSNESTNTNNSSNLLGAFRLMVAELIQGMKEELLMEMDK